MATGSKDHRKHPSQGPCELESRLSFIESQLGTLISAMTSQVPSAPLPVVSGISVVVGSGISQSALCGDSGPIASARIRSDSSWRRGGPSSAADVPGAGTV